MDAKVITLLVNIVAASSVQAADISVYPGPYPAEVVNCYDGDTCNMRVHIFPDIIVTPSVRVNGVDTPEIRGKCEAEKEKAEQAKTYTNSHLASGNVTLHDVQLGKYAGRVVATVRIDGVNLAEMLIETELGRRYEGGSREGWCD